MRRVRAEVGRDRPLPVTAGGSVSFDKVVAALAATAAANGAAILALRSGAIFFHDNGVYEWGLVEHNYGLIPAARLDWVKAAVSGSEECST